MMRPATKKVLMLPLASNVALSIHIKGGDMDLSGHDQSAVGDGPNANKTINPFPSLPSLAPLVLPRERICVTSSPHQQLSSQPN